MRPKTMGTACCTDDTDKGQHGRENYGGEVGIREEYGEAVQTQNVQMNVK